METITTTPQATKEVLTQALAWVKHYVAFTTSDPGRAYISAITDRMGVLSDEVLHQRVLTPDEREAKRNQYLGLLNFLEDTDKSFQKSLGVLKAAGELPPEYQQYYQTTPAAEPSAPNNEERNPFELTPPAKPDPTFPTK